MNILLYRIQIKTVSAGDKERSVWEMLHLILKNRLRVMIDAAGQFWATLFHYGSHPVFYTNLVKPQNAL